MIQLGLVSAILPELDLAAALALCRREGYAFLEAMCWPVGAAERRYAGVTHIDVNRLEEGGAERIAETIAASAVKISALGYYPNLLTPNQAESDFATAHLRKVIAAARRLDINLVTTFVGRDPHLSVDQNWPRFLALWPGLVHFAEDHGVRIAIENCPMSFTADEWPGGKNLATTPAIWSRMFNDIPSASFGLNYDPSHFIWQFIDEVEPIRAFASRILHVHAKDAALDRQRLNQVGIMATPLSFHAPRLPGLGDVRWGKFFAELTHARYRGPVCVEIEDRAYEESFDHRLGAIRQARGFLQQFFPAGAAV